MAFLANSALFFVFFLGAALVARRTSATAYFSNVSNVTLAPDSVLLTIAGDVSMSAAMVVWETSSRFLISASRCIIRRRR